MATRRYARKQIKWVNNRFLGRNDRQVPPVYGLDTTDVTLWDGTYISNKKCEYEPLPVQNSAKSTSNSEEDTFNCEICERVFVGEFQWQIHLRSNRHKRRLESKRSRSKI
ncbi:hypothetical protein NQ317_014939 [Molorchus minor]|uniref:C2H2-type domain-containing protein n=1 Tax=Molorchus minor TaxID=1323400 RepID=A0ABQ9K1V1_9CUCU|nr:hypothetical protein NQ317_014939 [Molorchus minor]